MATLFVSCLIIKHLCKKSLDFESNASANSATPARRSLKLRNQKRSSSASSCSRFAVKSVSPERLSRPKGDGYGVASIACKPRGCPRISRRRIASRKLDFDASNVAIFILKSARLATPKAVGAQRVMLHELRRPAQPEAVRVVERFAATGSVVQWEHFLFD